MHKRLLLPATALFALLAAAVPGLAQTTSYTVPGLSTYSVPATGYYALSVTGADGGDGGGGAVAAALAGTGATVTGTYYLSAGDQLSVIVGAKGAETHIYCGGGGGGTGIVLNGTTLLLAAGGGGGGSSAGYSNGYGGQGLMTPAQGGAPLGDAGGGGGFGASGGSAGCSGSGGGAASLTALSAGGSSCTGSAGGSGFGGGGAGGANGSGSICGGGGGYAGGAAGTRGGGGFSYYNPAGGTSLSVTPGITGGSGYASDLDGTASITPVPVTVGSIAGGPFVPGATISIPYVTGSAFSAGNSFTAQLSDASGSFSSAVSIGSLSATGSGTITATLPAGLRNGDGYLVRIVASNPAYTSAAGAAIAVMEANNALDLSGSSDYVVSGSNIGISGIQARTLEYYGTISTGYQHQANWGLALTNQAFGTYTVGGNLMFYAHDGNDFNTGFSADNQRHYVAVTYDGTHVRVYVDGSLTSAGAVARTLATANGPLYIGDRMDIYSQMSGSIDEVRVWNRALCQAEIQNNMGKILPAPSTQSGLVLYYKFNQGVASGTNTGISSIFDSSAAANHGSLVNFTRSGSSSNFVSSAISNTVASAFVPPVTATSSSSSQTISGNTQFNSSCYVLGNVMPSGASPVSGTVTTKVTIDGSVQSYLGNAYVQRHYDITPATNPNTATGFITLYFTQAEFNAYNAANGIDPDLPTGPADASGISHLRITQFHGSSATSAPGSYSGYSGSDPAVLTIAPTSITWDASAARWEVSFPVNGFSGFFAAGRGLAGSVALPVRLISFEASRQPKGNLLSWATASETPGTTYDIERSADGSSFVRIGTVTGDNTGSYTFTDPAPPGGTSYYRLNMSAGGEATFSRTVALTAGGAAGSVRVSPLPAATTLRITATEPAACYQLAVIVDMQGRELQRLILQPSQEIDLKSWVPGVYSLKLADGSVVRIIKQ